MAWSKTYTRTTEVRRHDVVLHCGLCGREVHVTRRDDRRYPEVVAHEADIYAEGHLLVYHPWRRRLWKMLGWRWLVGGLR